MQGAEPEASEKPAPDLPLTNGYTKGDSNIAEFEPAGPLTGTAPKPVSRSAYPSASRKGKPVSCPFCNAPHRIRALEKAVGGMCDTCKSPLFLAEDVRKPGGGRICERVRKTESVWFYVYWPGNRLPGRLFDISPTGMRLESEYGLHPGQIIKIDGVRFKAVGEVVHSQTGKNEITSSGIRFLSVNFFSSRGNFLDARV